MFSFLSVSVFMFTVYCLMDPCGLISNKDDDDDWYLVLVSKAPNNVRYYVAYSV